MAREKVAAERKAGRLSGQFEFHPQLGTPYGVVRRFLLGPKTGLPCTPPPWGTLAAVKATTGEGMGFVGREEGVAALAVATLAPCGPPPP